MSVSQFIQLLQVGALVIIACALVGIASALRYIVELMADDSPSVQRKRQEQQEAKDAVHRLEVEQRVLRNPYFRRLKEQREKSPATKRNDDEGNPMDFTPFQ